MSDVPNILQRIGEGDSLATNELLPVVYAELKRLASRQLANEPPGRSLQTTALVHEAYLRLVGSGQNWDGRGHFFAAAAESMRRILVDNSRRKRSLKGGGNLCRVELPDAPSPDGASAVDLLALDEALAKLESEEPLKAQLVKLRFFAGLSVDEAAAAMGISRATAKRYWVYARAWLYGEMETG